MLDNLLHRASPGASLALLTLPSNVPDAREAIEQWYRSELGAVARRSDLTLHEGSSLLGGLHLSKPLPHGEGQIELRSALPSADYRGVHQLRLTDSDGTPQAIIERTSPPSPAEINSADARQIAHGRVAAAALFAQLSAAGPNPHELRAILAGLDYDADHRDDPQGFRVISFRTAAEGIQGISSVAWMRGPAGVTVDRQWLRAGQGLFEQQVAVLRRSSAEMREAEAMIAAAIEEVSQIYSPRPLQAEAV